MEDCLACDLAAGRRPLPGGLIHADAGWRVEHCLGPLGLGTLIVKPERHVTSVAELTEAEAAALGPLLRRASAVGGDLVGAEQVYNCLWSHAGGTPVHIHYVVQPVTRDQMAESAVTGRTCKRRCSPPDGCPNPTPSRPSASAPAPPSPGSDQPHCSGRDDRP